MRWLALVWIVPCLRLSSAQPVEPYRYPVFFLPVYFVVLYFQETPVHQLAAVQIFSLRTVQAFVQMLSVLQIVRAFVRILSVLRIVQVFVRMLSVLLICHPPFLAENPLWTAVAYRPACYLAAVVSRPVYYPDVAVLAFVFPVPFLQALYCIWHLVIRI